MPSMINAPITPIFIPLFPKSYHHFSTKIEKRQQNLYFCVLSRIFSNFQGDTLSKNGERNNALRLSPL